MDFNTGASGSGGAPPPPPSRATSSFGGGREFNLSNPVGSFVETVRSLITSPVQFFRDLPSNAGLVNPLAFAVVCSIIAAIPAALLTALFSLFAGDASLVLGGIGFAVGLVILIPLLTVIGAFVGAAIYHVFVLLLARGNNAGFQSTFRVVCYAAFPNMLTFLAFIPILGTLVSLAISVYIIVLSIFGIREIHRTSTGRAAAVVLAPVAITILLSIVAVVIIAIAFGFSSSASSM